MLPCGPSASSGEVICETPNNKLDKFSGTLYWKENKYLLSNQNMLLRGCVLRNTEWCFGLVIFAGGCLQPGWDLVGREAGVQHWGDKLEPSNAGGGGRTPPVGGHEAGGSPGLSLMVMASPICPQVQTPS